MRRSRHPRLRLLAGLILAVLVAVPAASWFALRGSLPRYEGRVRSAAIAQPVQVMRDALGTVTVARGKLS